MWHNALQKGVDTKGSCFLSMAGMAGLGYYDVFVVFDAEVLHDEVAALGGVLAHIEAEDALGVEILVQEDGVETHVLVDEAFELVGRDFTEAFESGNLGVGGLVYGVDTLLVAVAVGGLLLVADAEEGGL